MRRLYLSATALFWLLVLAFWTGSLWPPAAEKRTTLAPERVISAAELAAHAQPDDCWMLIDGGVHDLSAYLPEHPSHPAIVRPWCGKDATEAYRTKTRGRPHSAHADELLARYRIGILARQQQ